MKTSTGSRRGTKWGLVLAVLVTVLVLPTEAAAVTSGGWSNLGVGNPPTTSALNDRVQTFYSVGNKMYVGGDFINAGGLPAGDHIAVWDGTSWSALGGGLGDPACAVYAIAVDTTTGLVFAGGSCQNAGGDTNADRIAVFNGTTWSSLQNVSLNGPVFALTVIGRYLYIAGGFSHQSLGTPANAIVRWNIDTHVVQAITPDVDTIGGTPSSIVPDGAGGFYLGGNFTDVDGDTAADFIAHWLGGTTWVRLGNVPLNARVRALSLNEGLLFAGGEFTGAGGAAGADKVARWNGTAWSAIGGSTFFGTSSGVAIYGIWADHGSVVATGYFNNAGGAPRMDGIAAFNGSTWTYVGTSANGAEGPVSLNTVMFCVRVIGATLYLGGSDSAIADNSLLGYAASYRFRQPDAQIKTGAAPTYVGNNIYNITGAGQSQSLTVHRGQAGAFNLLFGNDGLVRDSFKVKGPGTSGAFAVKYLDGVVDVTAQVVAGTYTINNLAANGTKMLVVQVAVGAGAVVGSSLALLVTATSTGGTIAKDAVKGTVTAS